MAKAKAKAKKVSAISDALRLKKNIIGGLIVYVSTVVVTNVMIWVLSLIGTALFDPNWAKGAFTGQMFTNIYFSGFLTGISMLVALLLFIVLSFFEERALLPKVSNLFEAVVAGLTYGVIFVGLDTLLSYIFFPTQQIEGGAVGFGISVQSALPYQEVFWALVAYVAILPVVLHLLRKNK